MSSIEQLNIKIFADGADKKCIFDLYKKNIIKGFTTNPTLMRKAGIQNYKAFAFELLSIIKDRPISFEVLSDDFDEMYEQALQISSWGSNVYVKIPITNSKGQFSSSLIQELARKEVKQNITAVMTLNQVLIASQSLIRGPSSYISVFAGRIADTGIDPIPLMKKAVTLLRTHPQQEIIWASTRELLNIFQANKIGCQVITVTDDILKKIVLIGKDLTKFSLETVKMFYTDSVKANFSLSDDVCEM